MEWVEDLNVCGFCTQGTAAAGVITLTDIAAQKVTEFLASQEEPAETAGLSVRVPGGGCSGFQYALALDEQRDGDQIF